MPRVFDDRSSRFRWSDRSAGTSDENGADFTFESVDTLCDPRRGQIEPACRFGDRTVIDRHQKGLKEPSIHCQLKVSSKDTVVYFGFAMADGMRTASGSRSRIHRAGTLIVTASVKGARHETYS